MADQAAERAAIIGEAYRLLDRSGGAAISVTEILANTGLSTRAFYRHFDTRDDLLLVMMRRDRDRVIAELRTVVTEAVHPVDALKKWVDVMFSLLTQPRRRRRVLTFYSEEMHRTRGYLQEMTRFSAAEQALLAQVIDAGRLKGYFPNANPGPDARSIRAAIEAGIAEDAHQPAGTPQETADEILAFILRALGAQQPAPNPTRT